MKQIIRVLKHYQLNILAGILIGTSYIPFPPWASLFCLVPLWWQWWTASRWQEVWWGGWITQFVLAMIGFHWVAYTAIEFGHLPWPIGVLVLFLFAALANLHIVIPGVIFYIIHSHRPMKPWQVAIFLPLSTVLLETWVPMIFPWNFGYPWYYARWPIYQIADTVGFVGLSAFTLLLNGILFWGWLQRKKSIRWKSAVATALSLFVLLNIFGWWKEKTFSPTDSKLRIAMVQANIGNLEKQIAEHQGRFRQEISDKFFRLSRQALSTGDVDLLLWPETAFPDFADDAYEKSYNPKRLRQFIQEIQTPLLTGAYSGDHGSQRTYNALFLFNSKGELVAAPYRKTILLAFGEYLPGASYFPILSQWIPMVSQFDRGSGPTVWTWNDLRLGLQICYEGLFPDFSRELSQKGAQIFLTSPTILGSPLTLNPFSTSI